MRREIEMDKKIGTQVMKREIERILPPKIGVKFILQLPKEEGLAFILEHKKYVLSPKPKSKDIYSAIDKGSPNMFSTTYDYVKLQIKVISITSLL